MPRILIVVTSHSSLGSTGRRTGYYLDEVAAPYYAFTDKGFTVDIASPAGGPAPVDPGSLTAADEASSAAARFAKDAFAQDAVAQTLVLSEVDASSYEAVFVAGGHGVMWDLADDEALAAVVADVDARGGVIASVCHGAAGLVSARGADGRPLVAGRRIASFTDAEEVANGLAEVVPFLLESRLRALGADLVTAPLWADNAVRDGNWVTGQNPASAHSAAALVLEALTA